MTIKFACACGQQLAARDEFAGKRVKCTACGGVRTVPGPAAREAGEMIRFSCSCGQVCQARSEFAGRNTKCPRCATVLTIPGEAEAGPPRRAAIRAEAPAPRAGR
jgi:phage FluMu protein Com